MGFVSKEVLAALMVRIGIDAAPFFKGVKKTANNMNLLKNGAKMLGSAIAGAFAISRITSFGRELVEIGQKAEGIERAFNRFADEGLLDDLRQATRNTVSDLVLMQKSVDAKNLKVPVQELAKFFKFASIRANETGQSVDFLVDSIVKGIGRKSVLIMDNLGISAIELQEEFKRTGDFGAAAANIINKELEALGDVEELTIEKTKSLRVEWENTKLFLAKEMLPVIDKLATSLSNYNKILGSENLKTFQKLAALTNPALEAALLVQVEYDNLKKKNKAFWDEWEKEVLAAAKAAKEPVPILEKLTTQLDIARQAQKAALTEKDLAIQNREIQILEELIKKYKELGTVKKPDKLDMSVDVKDAAIDIGTGEDERIDFGSIFDYTADLDKQIDELLKKPYVDGLVKTGEEIEQEFEAINSIIESGIENMVSGFAEGLGQLMVTGQFDPGLLLSPLADMAIQLGKMAVGTGIAIGGIKKAFSSLNPGVAIAAGIALIALGSAIKAGLQNMASGGASPGVSVSVPTAGAGSATNELTGRLGERASDRIQVEVTGKLKGPDIYLSNKRYEEEREINT